MEMGIQGANWQNEENSKNVNKLELPTIDDGEKCDKSEAHNSHSEKIPFIETNQTTICLLDIGHTTTWKYFEKKINENNRIGLSVAVDLCEILDAQIGNHLLPNTVSMTKRFRYNNNRMYVAGISLCCDLQTVFFLDLQENHHGLTMEKKVDIVKNIFKNTENKLSITNAKDNLLVILRAELIEFNEIQCCLFDPCIGDWLLRCDNSTNEKIKLVGSYYLS